MANKYQLINEMASETLKEITQNGESWIKFLNTASNNYKYSFNEQVLIYAQKPNATACADIETWNKKLRRWVNKGAKGIALLSMENGRNVLRHVFDISDTHSGINKDFKLWEIKPSYENGIIETLENSFGNLEVKSNLAEAIYSASINLVEDNYQDYLVDLKEVLDGSLLEKMQDIDLEGNFIVLLAKSISYMAMKRCGIDPTEHFNVSDFEMISSFNNKRVVSRLGAAISDIAEQELREIYSSVINYEKNYKLTNRTFVNNEKINYHNNEEKNNEGRNDYDRINIQSNGRLPNTTSSITKNEENGTGEILKNEGEIPKRTQKRVIRGINVRWQDGRTFRRNRANSPKENETDNNKSSREESNNRGNEKRESNELGTSNELNKEPSRRNDNVRANLQLNLFEDTYVPPIKELPSVDTQINSIQAQAEVENTPAFSFTQEMIDKTLIEGSNFSHSKYRIYEQFKRSLSAKENIIFLKHEYGIGGSSSAYSGADFGQEHDSKGIKLYKGYKDDRVELLINWSNVEQRLKEIIRLDRYFNDEEKIKYQEWLENDYEKEKWMLDRGLKENTNDFIDISSINIEKNYKLSNGNYFHFHTNDEGYYYAIYDNRGTEIDGGLLEYSENADKKTLDDIRKDLAKFTDITELADTNLEEVSQEFIDNLEQEAELKDIADRVESQIIANAISAVKELSEDPKTQFKIGQIIYLESDRKYRVEAINKELDEIVLLDQTMLENAHYPIMRNESYLRAVSLYHSNDRNFEEEITTNKQEIVEPKPKQEKVNYHIDDKLLGEGTPKEKVRRNIEAIKLLHKLEDENRLANSEEQNILSKYVGWGGLSEAFDENNSAWADEFVELYTALSSDEYAAARESTLTAFYTPPEVIDAIYKAMEQMGFREGNLLEPSCGIGNFIGMLPNSMENTKIYGVELDKISAGIAQQLYQKSSIAAQGFEEVNVPDSFFDGVVGNVPFGDFKVLDKRYDKYNFLIHDYFFAKSLDKLRPGGVMALVTSKGTMDKTNSSVRKYIAQRADLLGAIRLPNDTFKGNAGTEVVSDILFLQKRDRLIDIEPNWVQLGTTDDGITMNSYFVEHSEMILGEMKTVSGRFGEEVTCVPFENADLSELLSEAVANIHGEINDYEVTDELEEEDNSIPADPTVRNFSYTVVDDKIYFRENSRMTPVEVSATAENRIKGMIAVRDSVRNLIELQTEDYPDEEIKAEQSKLNSLYDSYTKKYGLINSRANISAFSDDSSFALLSALEVINENGELERKADMFFKRTIKPHKPVEKVDTASEALAVSMGEKAGIDMEYMSKLTGKNEETLYQDLKGVIFLNPLHGYGNVTEAKYLMADEYLSGNVREKLITAKKSAEVYPEDYKINVEALEKVQPKDLTASEISVRLGATWLPQEVIQQFMFEFLDTPRYAQWNIKVHFSPYTGEWNIEGKSYDRSNVKAYSTYGTGRINAYKIIEETLNLKDVRIFDYIEDDEGRKKAVLNKKETAIAQAKQELIKQGFQDWIWADPDRREKLTKMYNEKFNSIRPREYDGSHITFSGMNPEITLREHQRNAVAHILYGGNTLLAHAVGAGKTFEMVAASQESKRLGLCNKSLFVVPNHLTEQWAAEYLQLYPSANILVATKKDFETKNRKKFCGRIATGDYDAVIIGHSQFEKIPMSIERQRAILEQQLNELTEGIAELKRNRGENFSVKQLEKSRKSVKQKLQKLNDQSRKDDVVTFEELGVDRLFIDESHYYKNLYLYTKMRNVGGIAQTEAQKSSDLFMKCRYLDEITGGRGTVFATGTPISNSMVELYTIQRYLQYNTLVKNGLQHFDAWASTFGETVTAIELTPEGTGYRAKTRFAKFYNLPELMAMFKEVADIKTADMLNLPVPEAEYHNVSVEPSEMQKEMVASLAERAEKVRGGGVDSSVDNMLKITNDGRKLALDQRMLNAMLPDFENSKINACVDNVYRIWEENKDKKSAQLVFCDLSTPKNDGTFSVYNDIRKKLIERGVPESEVRFIHEAETDVKKKELFQKVRKGEVRVLMGSTQKMGAGTNVQDRLIALHDVDCPWRPADLEQRSGRIIRQGNSNPKVEIYRYVTKQTFDAYLYQLVEGKQKFASQIMTSKSPVRSAEDIDETALSYAEIKMLATGNPYIKEKMDLDIQVQKLKLLKSNFLSEKYSLEDKIIKYYPQRITSLENRINGLTADVETAKQHPKPTDDRFVGMEVKGVFYSEKAEAGKAIIAACKEMTSPAPVPLGRYRGFETELSFDTTERFYCVTVKGETGKQVSLGDDVFGNITRIDNAVERFADDLEKAKDSLADTKNQFETAQKEVQKPFVQEEELKSKLARLDELNILLNMDKKENEIVGGEPDEGESTEKRKEKSYER